MGQARRRALQRIYQKAKREEDLPWHRPKPPAMLRKVVEERQARRGRALDVGCGAGAYSLYLAQQGYEVTGLDYLAEPILMAQKKAEEEGAAVRFLQADVLSWAHDGAFDLVLDSGCLHCLSASERPAYRRQLLSWLGHAADYVLVHFAKRHLFDWRPTGPLRRKREQIVSELEPELLLRFYAEEDRDSPFPIGPTVRIGSYWFRRA
jgi:SAM-dependent methyltransferase